MKILDGNDSSRKFTISYQNPEGSTKEKECSEVTSNASVPVKYEEQLR